MATEQTKNFATSLVATAPSPASSGTSLVVTGGEGSRFPTPPFDAQVVPVNAIPTPANAEVVRVTGISTDTFTITRSAQSSSARTIVVGDRIYTGPTVGELARIDTDLAAKQPLDSDLTAIAALSTTTFGRSLLTQADAAATQATVGVYSTALVDLGFSVQASNVLPANGQPGLYAPSTNIFGISDTAITASRAYFARVVPPKAMTISIVGFVLTTFSTGNDEVDIGYYTVSGANLTRVASTGATTGKLNTSTGVKTVTGLSWALTAGTIYYFAISVGTITGGTPAIKMANSGTAGGFELFGTANGKVEAGIKATSHPLPSGVTGALSQAGTVPILVLRES